MPYVPLPYPPGGYYSDENGNLTAWYPGMMGNIGGYYDMHGAAGGGGGGGGAQGVAPFKPGDAIPEWARNGAQCYFDERGWGGSGNAGADGKEGGKEGSAKGKGGKSGCMGRWEDE
ncbi:MAG: hypothetical protein M1818_007387 [Claussenomyces sp. TS43310]|nr:MAG: hypothetical protein M1818_007387 [Claussenomyces sp. TS43310]